jgi:hypothetical protein
MDCRRLISKGVINYLCSLICSKAFAWLMRFAMQLLASRTYTFIDSQSLVECQARDTLFRVDGSFVLHMSSRDRPDDDDRLVWFDSRAALMWINATSDEFGAEWG